ncbi:MAG: hypothetical protein ACM3MK_04515 [Chitinophagales bacterium]
MNKTKVNTVIDLILFVIILSIFFMKGEFHEALAYTLGTLVIVHIVLHWKQFTAMFRNLIPDKTPRVLVGVLIGAIILAILTSPLYLSGSRMDNDRDFDGPPDRYEMMEH